MKPYKDHRYAVTRIRDTIVMDGNTPVEVCSDILSNMEVRRVLDGEGTTLKNKSPVSPILVRDLKSKNLSVVCVGDITPSLPELGYVNHRGVASYIARLPKRRDWRQGIRYSNLVSYCGLPMEDIPYSAIADTLTNTYPTFERCIQSFAKSKTLRSIAWHRDWSVDKDGVVFHESIPVGALLEGRVSLSKEFLYLQEALDESRR